MSQSPHSERHFTATDVVRDIVIGMSDGLTVPFALAAGLSGAVDSTAIIVTAGLAEIAAGAIAMGLGGYLAARSDSDHYHSEVLREKREIVEKPDAEAEEVAEVFRAYGLTDRDIEPVLARLRANPEKWVDFMMRFELGLDAPQPRRAFQSAGTIAASYIAGGIIPLAPYILLPSAAQALLASVVVTLIALFGFGWAKGQFTGARPLRSAIQTAFVGSLAAGAAFTIARLIS